MQRSRDQANAVRTLVVLSWCCGCGGRWWCCCCLWWLWCGLVTYRPRPCSPEYNDNPLSFAAAVAAVPPPASEDIDGIDGVALSADDIDGGQWRLCVENAGEILDGVCVGAHTLYAAVPLTVMECRCSVCRMLLAHFTRWNTHYTPFPFEHITSRSLTVRSTL